MTNKTINQYGLNNAPLETNSLVTQSAAGVTERIELKTLMNCYGDINFQGVGGDQNPGLIPQKIVGFDTGTSSTGVTGDFTNSRIIINSPGSYDFKVGIHAAIQDLTIYTISMLKNGSSIGEISGENERRDLELSFNTEGFIQGLVATDYLELAIHSDQVGGATFAHTYLLFKCIKVGQ